MNIALIPGQGRIGTYTAGRETRHFAWCDKCVWLSVSSNPTDFFVRRALKEHCAASHPSAIQRPMPELVMHRQAPIPPPVAVYDILGLTRTEINMIRGGLRAVSGSRELLDKLDVAQAREVYDL